MWICPECSQTFKKRGGHLIKHGLQKPNNWSKGLTKETDPRVALLALKSTKTHRERGYRSWSKGLTKETHPGLAHKGWICPICERVFKVTGQHLNSHDPEKVKRMSEVLRRKWKDPSYRQHISESTTSYWQDPEFRNRGKRGSASHKRKNSESKKESWKTPAYVQKQRQARNVSPNHQELFLLQYLEDNYPGQWEFVGDGKLILSGKCPDFLNKTQKKLIEFFGDYWHRGEDPEVRKFLFALSGYQTLVLWQKDVLNGKYRDLIRSFLLEEP